jgi:hypothetical protein
MLSTQYKKLFSLNVYHDYHLNDGSLAYDDLEVDVKTLKLRKFNWQDFLYITPTRKTLKIFKRFQLLTKLSNQGLIVFARVAEEDVQESFIPLEEDLVLEFFIGYRDPYFENYTAMKLLKEDKMLFSNFRHEHFQGLSFDLLPLENEDRPFSDSFLIPEDSFTSFFTEAANKIIEAQAKGLLLIRMQGEDGSLNVTNINGTLKVNPPVFKIQFTNRSTYWTYHHQRNNSSITTNTPKPLTKNGFVQILPDSDFDEPNDDWSELQFPNPGVERIRIEANNYYSEIYI